MKRFTLAIGAALLGCVTFFSHSAVSAQSTRDPQQALAAISRNFEASPTMAGEFIQFGPDGEQTGGKFYISRPGRIRFDYEAPSHVKVVSNGRTLGVNNKKLKTWNYYPLRKTPLSLVLGKKIDLKDSSIRSVEARDDITTIVMGNKRIFGNSEITMMFDPQTQDLRQWTIKDKQGKETSVMIFNVQKNVKISKQHFYVKRPSHD